MRETMEPKVRAAVDWLRPSMPRAGRRPPVPLLRLALAELRPGLLAVALGLALLAGLAAAATRAPLVCTVCAVPLPLLLLYARYFWRDNAAMRELERTFRFSFCQMASARFAVLFGSSAAALTLAALAASLGGGGAFLRLAACGAASAALLGGGLLHLSARSRDGSPWPAGLALWAGLCAVFPGWSTSWPPCPGGAICPPCWREGC